MRLPLLASAVVFAGTALAPGAAASSPAESPQLSASPTANSAANISQAEGPIVQMFAWPWDSLAEECTSSLGPSGYPAIQVSVPTEHVQLQGEGYPWYEDYQPVSYKLASRRGDAEQFKNMVSACTEAGVKVYVDVVLNHMSGSGSESSGPGSGGTEYSKYNYPGTYGDQDFHGCRRDIENYEDKWEVRNCELVGLSDLNTGSDYVRNTEIDFLNGLIDMGVSGFRIDAAKHMSPADIAAILAGVKNLPGGQAPYIYQEVIADSATQPGEYTGNGDVTEFAYHDRVSNAFRNGSIAELKSLPNEMSVESDKANVFVANHDTERSAPTLTYKDGAAYDLANAFAMAFPFGAPRLVSGFDYGGNVDAGPPSDSNGFTSPASCGDDSAWVCTHRHPLVAGMAGFAKAVQGETELTNWWDNGSNMIAFGRGAAGFVVLNATGAGKNGAAEAQEFTSSLPAGTYCNVLTGEFQDGQCTGDTVQVAEGGTFTAEVPANSGVALHIQAKVS